jgi:hypothetical protein
MIINTNSSPLPLDLMETITNRQFPEHTGCQRLFKLLPSICLQIDDFEDVLHYYLDAMELCFANDEYTLVLQDICTIQMGIDACYKGRILKYVNESYKTNGIFNCASAA